MLSIVIPVYNERKTIATVVATVSRALPAIPKEIIIVDDCSNDGTRQWLKDNLPEGVLRACQVAVDGAGNLFATASSAPPDVIITAMYHDRNKGKGGSLRTGFAAASGEVIVIQDADLEYDPQDWATMYDLIAIRKVADIVYGSRFYGRPHRSLYFHHYLANRIISITFNILYNQTLTDIEVCYKMFTRAVKDSLKLTCDDFGCEIQISAQVSKARKWRIYETAIHYFGRTYAEGKKIDWRDGIKALWYLIKFRLVS